MYKVIKPFGDLQDAKQTKDGTFYYTYDIGDEYPRQGYTPSPERVEELSGSDNKQGTPLIEEVKTAKSKANKRSGK